ncbi:hypothetical protein B0T20DRAFT_389770 [Sordaria brevicollis]|uniref:Uncharacterized protein n=1 Tax=Sordaria brevicollis TaxID=83679 RepID=A0AAE0UF52_SORBR|nr:hypothetical protein B0T20DRAFT_389770 [Sordaria brevicollis]
MVARSLDDIRRARRERARQRALGINPHKQLTAYTHLVRRMTAPSTTTKNTNTLSETRKSEVAKPLGIPKMTCNDKILLEAMAKKASKSTSSKPKAISFPSPWEAAAARKANAPGNMKETEPKAASENSSKN